MEKWKESASITVESTVKRNIESEVNGRQLRKREKAAQTRYLRMGSSELITESCNSAIENGNRDLWEREKRRKLYDSKSDKRKGRSSSPVLHFRR